MLQVWSAGARRPLGGFLKPSHTSSVSRVAFRTRIRASSSVPERTRKLPFSQEAWKLKPWQRSFAFGICMGATIMPAWLYYEKTRVQDSFKKYKLVRKDVVSSTASIFHVEPQDKATSLEIYNRALERSIWNVELKQPQIQIVRAYTPLPPTSNGKQELGGQLRFLIRRDPQGEVSNYVHSLPIGSSIELRGPNMEYALPDDIKQVVFFAGGTGIAPALQVAHAMFGASNDVGGASDAVEKKLHIMWANRRREDCRGGISEAGLLPATQPKSTWSGFFTKEARDPVAESVPEPTAIVKELDQLKKKHPGQITVEYFINEEDTWIDGPAVLKALSTFDDIKFSADSTAQSEQRQIIVSGPPGFIAYLVGPKEWRNGREEQGGISKLVAHALSKNPHHVKIWKV